MPIKQTAKRIAKLRSVEMGQAPIGSSRHRSTVFETWGNMGTDGAFTNVFGSASGCEKPHHGLAQKRNGRKRPLCPRSRLSLLTFPTLWRRHELSLILIACPPKLPFLNILGSSFGFRKRRIFYQPSQSFQNRYLVFEVSSNLCIGR